MPCGCGRSYIVNEDYGFPNRRKKDTSFSSFITVLLVFLLLLIVIYCIFITVNKTKGDNQIQSDGSTQNLHGNSKQTTTNNTIIFYDNSDTTSTKSYTEPSEIVSSQTTGTPFVTIQSNKIDTTTKNANVDNQFNIDLKTTKTNSVEKTTPSYDDTTLYINPYDAVTKFYTEHNAPNSDSSTKPNKALTEYIEIVKTTETNIEGMPITDLTSTTEINGKSSTQEGITALETETPQMVLAVNDTGTTTFRDNIDNIDNLQDINKVDTDKYVFSSTEVNNEQIRTEFDRVSTEGEPRIKDISETDFMYNTETPKQTTWPENINAQITGTQDTSDVTTDALEASMSPRNIENLDEDNSQLLKNNNVCTRAVCKEKASKILQLMNHSMDPCEDFYQFSCGGANINDLASFRYIDDLLKHVYTSSNSKDKYLKSFQKFFGSCMKYENEYGYSTKINQVLSITIRDNNLTSLLSFLMLRQSTPLFEVRFGFVGGKEGYGMQILPPDSNYETTGLREWSLQSQIKKHCLIDPKLKYQNNIHLVDVYEEYRTCKEKTFKRMADNFVAEKLARARTPNKITSGNFLSFFSNMNKIAASTLQDALLHQKYTKTYIKNLNQKYPQIDWQDFFNKITGKEFDVSTPIFLYLENEYFEQIMSDLKDRMLKTKKDVIETLKLYYQLELYQNLLSPKQNSEQFCMDQAVQLMPEIATKIFYEISGLKGFNNSLVTNTFKKLKESFNWLIEGSHLEEVNKAEYKFKLEKLTLKLFTNDEAWEKYLEESYQSFYLTDDYLSNVFMFVENNRRRRNSYDEVFLATQFLDRQFSQVPTTIPNTNKIVIPNTFLHKLSETQEYPGYIFESYLKFHLNTVLALHLDDIDRNLSSKSTFYKQFLSNLNSNLENGDDTKMLIDQRLSYKPELTLWQQIVQMSETTRMADNVALDMTFNSIYVPTKSFSTLPWIPSDYSNQHLFFVLIVQEYCESPTIPAFGQRLYESSTIPSTFRIDHMIMNSDTFIETFKCARGTPMNPEEKTQFDSFAPESAYTSYEYDPASK